MKIRAIEAIPVNVPINPDRAIIGSRGGHVDSPFVVLKVHTDEGIVGLGEVSCTPIWSGEDQGTAIRIIERYLAPALIGQNPFEVDRLAHVMARAVANNPFTRAGVEIALWDILGKAAGLSLHQLWGETQREFVPTKFSVSGAAPERAAAIALWAVEQGFSAMKVKVGRDLAQDLERVTAVRDAVGRDVRLGVDANGGWSPWVAVQSLSSLSALDIWFLEQPVAPTDITVMAQVKAKSPIPVLADESISTSVDAVAAIRADAADAFSIYVGKGGGLSAARRIAAVAAAGGLACTVGSNLEMGIATAAMIHLGMVLPAGTVEAFPCDILSVFFYEHMLVSEPLPVEAGCARPPAGPGLGVDLDEEAVAHYRVE
jgi:L-alanine-DL-glutamate epimerase-like enolase superfamily enzyme